MAEMNPVTERKEWHGVSASSGMVIGRAVLLPSFQSIVPRRNAADGEVMQEMKRFQDAVKISQNQIQKLIDDMDLQKEHQAIFEAQIMLLEDPMLIEDSRTLIQYNRINAEWAIATVLDSLKERLGKTDDPVIRERISDLEDIGNRLLSNLMNSGFSDARIEKIRNLPEGSVLFAESLHPTMMLQMGSGVAGIVTEKGGVTGHTAILARDRGIPALVNAGSILEFIKENDTVLLDGVNGHIILNPDDADRKIAELYLQEQDQWKSEFPVSPVYSDDGHFIRLWANIDGVEDSGDERLQNLTGVGLFRTEFLYLKDPTLLDHAHRQREVYSEILSNLKGKPVTFRLLDIGDDKKLHAPIYKIAGSTTELSRNLRGVRFLLANLGILSAQIRAITEAALDTGYPPGACRMMIPLVTRREEIISVRDVYTMIKTTVGKERGMVVPDLPLGIMLETPASVIMADALTAEADFASIGTNDLSRFTLGIKRTETRKDDLLFYQPSVFRMISMVLQKARSPVSICGEIAGEPQLAPVLAGLGLQDFSCSVNVLPKISYVLKKMYYSEAVKLAEKVMNCPDADCVVQEL